MDTTLLPRSSWKMAGRRNSLGRIYGSLVRGFSCKEVKVAWASCRRYSSGLQGFAAVCQRPFHRLHKWKQSLCLFLSMVCITAQRDYGFLVCKQLSKIMTFILSRFFRSFISTSTNSPKSLSYNAATKQCPVHVCQMYLPLSLSWSIFQWLLSLSWLRWIQPRQRFCPEKSKFTVILISAFYRLQEEMIKYTKVACMLDRSSGTLSQIFTTVVKSKL